MGNIKLREFLDMLRKENLIEQLKENGTETRTEDWMIEKYIIILIILERIDALELKMYENENKIKQIINTHPEIITITTQNDNLRVQKKSLEVKLQSEQYMLDNVLKAKFEDIRKKFAIKIHDDNIWVSLDVI